MQTDNKHAYLAPEVEVIMIAVEQCFATSSNFEDPVENEEQDW